MTNITIANNIVEGRESLPVRLRIHEINLQNGDKQPTDIVFDIAPGEEHRVNLMSKGTGFEVRPVEDGDAFLSDEKVTPDIFGIINAFNALKKAVRNVPAIRNDATLSSAERDEKAAAAWALCLQLAR